MFDINSIFETHEVNFIESTSDLLSGSKYYFSAPKEWLKDIYYKWNSVKEACLTLEHPGFFPNMDEVKCSIAPVVESKDGWLLDLGAYDVYLHPHYINALLDVAKGIMEKHETAFSNRVAGLHQNNLE